MTKSQQIEKDLVDAMSDVSDVYFRGWGGEGRGGEGWSRVTHAHTLLANIHTYLIDHSCRGFSGQMNTITTENNIQQQL